MACSTSTAAALPDAASTSCACCRDKRRLGRGAPTGFFHGVPFPLDRARSAFEMDTPQGKQANEGRVGAPRFLRQLGRQRLADIALLRATIDGAVGIPVGAVSSPLATGAAAWLPTKGGSQAIDDRVVASHTLLLSAAPGQEPGIASRLLLALPRVTSLISR